MFGDALPSVKAVRGPTGRRHRVDWNERKYAPRRVRSGCGNSSVNGMRRGQSKAVVVMVLAASASAQTSDTEYALGFQSSWPVWGVSVMKPVREDIAETTIPDEGERVG